MCRGTEEILEIILQKDNYIYILSYLSGFIGTVIIFFYGVPNKIDTGGKISLVLQQENEEEKVKIKKFRKWSNFGLILIALSFLIQILLSISKIIKLSNI